MHLEDSISHYFNSFLESLSDPVFIFGDFNLHHPMWGSNHTSPYSEIFVEWLTNSNFILLNTDVPTHRSNVGSDALLDFTLCSSNLIVYSNTFMCVSDSSYNSDHCPVITDFNFHNPIKRTINKVDWRSVTERVKLTAFGIDDRNHSDNIAKIISNNNQKIKICNKTFPPWWNTICLNLYKLKNASGRKPFEKPLQKCGPDINNTQAGSDSILKRQKRRTGIQSVITYLTRESFISFSKHFQ
ncbi:hypothetical protein TNCV_2231071 [Trichonephila clavipes]|nr:hypothetical protein TNCV_2231071 [Trichonephila clavipes]